MGKRKPCILIIDNDDAIATALELRLGSLGYQCILVSDGQQGLEVFSMGGIDLVITDLNMPGIDGPEVIQTLRQNSRVPIIAITGYSREYRRDMELLDVVVLRKPFPISAIIDLVEAELIMNGKPAAI